MKKILFCMFALCGVLLYSSSSSTDLSWCTKKTFKISVYYSPVVWQSFYYRWNFKAETRLNGNGTHGASWKPVFNGMIAAPKNYKFWTKIYFPWLWVWQVEDRGSAIVKAWQRWEEYDRIDIRVGRWSDALARTLSFGKQVKVWYICPSNKNLKVGFDQNKFGILNNFFNRTFWTIWLSSGRNDKRTEILQTYLKKLGYFKYGKTTWFFWTYTKQALIEFQKDYWIKSHYGYFGPQTRSKLRSVLFQKWLLTIKSNSYEVPKKIDETKKENTPKQSDIVLAKANIEVKKSLENDLINDISEQFEQNISKKDQEILNDLKQISSWLGKNSDPEKVKILQKYLTKLKFYKWKIDWKYDYAVISAVANFQLKYKIVSSLKDKHAWYFGSASSKKLKEIVKTKLIN